VLPTDDLTPFNRTVCQANCHRSPQGDSFAAMPRPVQLSPADLAALRQWIAASPAAH
jgi:hypothetical protein